ncbi:membrane protein insertase YidC [Terrimonas sp. NA20]|uniref:Membrane protein insertase YidC n=1 Tax=Terrimonas ginsenosidimutans TaxID=2908004 RepID=A0ABS9KRM4_9BACT|nr:membrane protein insertase YidC [Terrimonas ginsenosidimutans]MCG2614990.1 membrane protein insertase YidC [Terrimonas ginsenosidimutans]
MKFDRNTVLGFVVLAALFFGYFFFTNKEQAAYRKEKAKQDSILNANKPKPDTAAQRLDSAAAAALRKSTQSGFLNDSSDVNEHVIYAENELFRVAFSSKGGQPRSVELKKFKNMDSGHVKLSNSAFNQISYRVNTGAGNSIETSDLNFSRIDSVKNADGSSTYSFTRGSSDSSNTTSIVHRYTIKPGQYMIDFDVELNGVPQLLSQNNLNLTWQYAADQQESDISFEKQNTQVGYIEDGDFDYHTIGRTSSVDLEKKVKWVGVRQRFFNTFLVSKSEFTSGKMTWNIPPDDKKVLVEAVSNMQVAVPSGSNAKLGFSIFYGPADFKTLKQADLKLEKLVNLGQGPYAFVRPLNRYVIMPVWDFLKSFVGSFGLVIALLTLIIRLLISPLSYKSYLSGAKMKALRPEIATLKEKFGADQQAMSMEQMKLFREAGVNPLGGCIPALLQIPIFFSLYSFFSSSVDLRGADFLWAKDLSAFDDFIKFGVDVPLLGGHLSLFTITAVITSLAISLYSMSMSPDQSNPVLKYMPYIFPVFLLFIFNKLPSALTWYYTVSNIITLILQFVIQNYIIDHNKILAQIAENRKKPKQKSKWQERMEQMQEQQKQMKDAQKKNKK